MELVIFPKSVITSLTDLAEVNVWNSIHLILCAVFKTKMFFNSLALLLVFISSVFRHIWRGLVSNLIWAILILG